VVYVDDIIFGGIMNKMCQEFAMEMQKEFDMYMLGETSLFIGLQIFQYDKSIFISQTKYIKKMLKKFKIEYCAPLSTPMVTGCKLSKDNESPKENQTLYKSMIYSLLYVMASRPDIMQVVGLVAQCNTPFYPITVIMPKNLIMFMKLVIMFLLMKNLNS
jgi:hypothetical protein